VKVVSPPSMVVLGRSAAMHGNMLRERVRWLAGAAPLQRGAVVVLRFVVRSEAKLYSYWLQ
jgi:hypothetical protein